MDLKQDGEPSGVAETARYINNMARELRVLAVRADLGFLAYLLSMVEDDAYAILQKESDRI